MRSAALLGIMLPVIACAHESAKPELTRKGTDRSLFVGHTNTGVMVVAAKHYDAMNGLAVLSGDIEGTNVDDGSTMLCRREVITGSHFPQWICRPQEDHARISEADRTRARMFLQSLNNTCTDGCAQK
jgi:hypothetical protein